MKKVKGVFKTRYGACRFAMTDAKTVTIWLGSGLRADTDKSIFCHRVEYNGQFRLQRLDTGNGEWTEISGHNAIRRVDGKEISYRGSYPDMLKTLINDWTVYITHGSNKGVLTLAAHVKVENERDQYVSDIANLEEKLRVAKVALEQYDTNKGDVRKALLMGVANLKPNTYDTQFVHITND